MLESLEARRHFSGVVTVTTDYGSNHRLKVQGDDAANEVGFFGGFSNTMEEEASYDRLVVYNGTLIVDGTVVPNKDGQAVAATVRFPSAMLANLGGRPLIDLAGGDDHLILSGDRDNGFAGTEIFTGQGNDRVTAEGGFESLQIDTGAGNDRVSVRTALDPQEGFFGSGIDGIKGNLNIFTGPGRDRITLDSDDTFLVRGKLRIVDNSGSTQIGMHAVRAKHGALISTGNAADYLTFHACYFYRTTAFVTRAGDDVITLRKTGFVQDQDAILLTGSGHDKLEYLAG